MKRGLLYIAIPLLLGIALFVALSDQDTSTDTAADKQASTRRDSAAGTDIASSDERVDEGADDGEPMLDLGHPVPPVETRLARVQRLADGDSFDIEWIDTGESDELRLFGINAPEGGACFGNEARDILDVLTRDQELLVESIERDDFGRVLANVWVANVLVNLRLVEQGAALALTDSSQYGQLIRDAQAIAQSNGMGLWDPAFCGTDDEAQIVIAEIFENAPGPDNENPNGEWIDILNAGAATTDMSDWSIRDESTRHRFFFPDGFALDAGSTVRVFSGCGADDASSLYWCDGDPVWNNGGDTAFLVDSDGRFVDTLTYSG